MKKVWMMILALVLATVLCTAAAEAPKTEVVVFAAASMTETLTEIEALYEKANPEIFGHIEDADSGRRGVRSVHFRRTETDEPAGHHEG